MARRSFAAVFAMMCAVSTADAQAPWKPERNVEILIASTAGTGPNRLARMIQRFWSEQKDLQFTSSVVTRPGGGGTILWSYMNQKRGDPHHLMITSHNIVVNHIAASLLLKAAGIDLKKVRFVIYSGNNESTISVMGGHTGMTAGSVGGIAPHFSNGHTRVLAFAAPQRIGGMFASVPTLTELGYPVVANNWRTVMAPKELAPAQAAYWDDAFKSLAASEEWNRELQAQYLANSYLGAADLRRYLDRQYGEVRQILGDLGMVKVPGK